ncbi:MAG: hypothetical protein M3R58_09695 [Pseudomonadota bacterium]|nr:hypothetical protein [Pseudomonadota bacterium]
MSERRKLRLMREALGADDGTVPGAESQLRAMGIVALVLFVVLFSGTFQA